jgi:hypothetical protein
MKLRLDANLYWYWNLRNVEQYAEIVKDFEKLVSNDYKFYETDSTCIVSDQPIWKLHDCWGEGNIQNWIKGNKKNTDFCANHLSSCRQWGVERLAYYASAHIGSADQYGIHLSMRGIANLAYQVSQDCPGEPLEIVQMAAMYFLFAHQKCHAWIEDICCLIEFSNEETSPKIERNYSKAQQHYNGYIFMEEAICNTAAFGWLYHFLLDQEGELEPSLPIFNSDQILYAFECWMRCQPQGFRDFLPVTQLPHQSKIFVQNVCRLLIEVYRITDHNDHCSEKLSGWHNHIPHVVSDAVGLFFGGDFSPDFNSFHCHKNQSVNALWSGNLMIHLEA